MTHTRDGRTLKEFRAIRPVTKFMVSRVRLRATARSARRLLDEALAAFPFAVSSTQVDGGGEFMAEFEDTCAKLSVQLHVPPPRRPQWNDCVECANRSVRIEFRNRCGGPPRWRRRRRQATQARVPPQLRAASHGPGLPNPQRGLCPDGKSCLSRLA